MSRRTTLKKWNKFLGPAILRLASLLAPAFEGRSSGRLDIVLLKLVGLGDSVLMLPIIHLIRKTFPGCGLYALASPITAPLFEGNADLSGLIKYDVLDDDSGIGGALRVLRRIRGIHPSTLIDFEQHFFLTPAYCAVSGAQHRIGLVHREHGRGAAFTHRVPYDDGAHMLRAYYDLYVALCSAYSSSPRMFEEALEYRIQVPASGRARCLDWKRRQNLNKPLIGIHPGSGGTGVFRRWPWERFAELTRAIARTGKYEVILVGGKVEEPLLGKIREAAGCTAVHIFSGCDFGCFLALLADMACFIANDSGPMHIAAWLKVPTIGLFGPQLPSRYAPLNQGAQVLYHGMDCSPCIQIHKGIVPEACVNPVIGACMRAISVEEVLFAALAMASDVRR